MIDIANGVLNTEQNIPLGYSTVAEPTNIVSDGKLCDPNVQQYRYFVIFFKNNYYILLEVGTFTFLDFLGKNLISSGFWNQDPIHPLIPWLSGSLVDQVFQKSWMFEIYHLSIQDVHLKWLC